MSVTVEIKLVGKLWIPRCDAAATHKLTLGEGPFQTDIEPTQGDIEYWIHTHSGDFSEVTDYEAEISTPIEPCGDCGHARFSYRTLGWADPDSEYIWFDCSYPEDD